MESLIKKEETLIQKDSRSIDMVSVLSAPTAIIQTEVRMNKDGDSQTILRRDIKKAECQIQFFKDYLTRIHGSAVSSFAFIPIIAFPNLQTLPSGPELCYCANQMPVARFELSESAGVTKAGCLGKKYSTCNVALQGKGCLYFKWEDEDKPAQQSTTTESTHCFCGNEPLGFSVPLQQRRKGKGGTPGQHNPKQFQVCRFNGCEFFCWINEPERGKYQMRVDAQSRSVFKDGSCKKHFMFKQHIEHEIERKKWWAEILKEHTADSSSEKYDTLRSRLIITTSMLITKLPRLLSRSSSDSQLILLR